MKKRVGLLPLTIIQDTIASKLRQVERDIEISLKSFAKNPMVVLLLVFILHKKVESHIMSHTKIKNKILDQRVHQVALASIPNGKYWIGIGQAEEGTGTFHQLFDPGRSVDGNTPLTGYEWSDGSAANYFNWNQNIESEAETICSFVAESGHWHHSLCNETIGVVCNDWAVSWPGPM